MYSFLLHSQVIRHTHTSQVSTILACPGVRLSGNTTAVIIGEREERGRTAQTAEKFTDVDLNELKRGDLKIVLLLSVTVGQASSGEESGL